MPVVATFTIGTLPEPAIFAVLNSIKEELANLHWEITEIVATKNVYRSMKKLVAFA